MVAQPPQPVQVPEPARRSRRPLALARESPLRRRRRRALTQPSERRERTPDGPRGRGPGLGAPRDLRGYLARLAEAGELVEIEAEVDPDLELAEVHRRVIAAGGPALLFR